MAKKKEKVTYIDDGRTVADMSGVSSGFRIRRNAAMPHPKFKDVVKTYFGAVKMMFVPMLVVICALIVIYMLMSFLFLIM